MLLLTDIVIYFSFYIYKLVYLKGRTLISIVYYTHTYRASLFSLRGKQTACFRLLSVQLAFCAIMSSVVLDSATWHVHSEPPPLFIPVVFSNRELQAVIDKDPVILSFRRNEDIAWPIRISRAILYVHTFNGWDHQWRPSHRAQGAFALCLELVFRSTFYEK